MHTYVHIKHTCTHSHKHCHTHILSHKRTHIHIYIYTYMYIYMYMYVHTWDIVRENMVVFKCCSWHKSNAPKLKVGLAFAKLEVFNLL